MRSDGTTGCGFVGRGDQVISGGSNADLGISTGGGNLVFGSGGTSEKARIDTSGRLLLDTTTAEAAHADADDFIIGRTNKSESGMTIVTSTGGNGTINFSDGASSQAQGQIQYYQGTNYFSFDTNGSEAMRIDSSGRVGIGTTSPGDYYANQLVVDTGSAAQSGITIVSDSSNQGMFAFARATNGANRYRGFLDYNHSNDSLAFGTDGSEKTRIDSAGRFLHGLTSPNASSVKFEVAANVGPDPAYQFTQTASSGLSYDLVLKKQNYAPDDNSSRFLTCADSSGDRLHIKSDGDVLNHDNSYGSLSDVSLKQQIVDASSQWDDIKDVRVRKFKMNSDVEAYGDEAGFRIGVIAQELEQTSPGLVKNNAEPDGTILKSVSYSVLYMKAIKALQEAQTRIETLETQHASLEARLTALEGGS